MGWQKEERMENLRSYSTYYYSEKHPLKETKYQFKKIYLSLLNYVGLLHFEKEIVKYKLEVFKKYLRIDNSTTPASRFSLLLS